MVKLKHLITVPISLSSFVLTFYAVGKLMWFLSNPRQIRIEYVWLVNLMDNISRFDESLRPMHIDVSLVILFILQHSFMRAAIFKNILKKLGLETIERSLYNMATSGMLLFLIRWWHQIPAYVAWQVDVDRSKSIWWIFVATHVLAWTVVYGGSILMDLPELLGVKQVYYDIHNLLPPIVYKSKQLRRLYGHVRHPSFAGLAVVLWVTNIMSLDRLLLASLWTVYMYVSWSTDANDVAYHKCQLTRKKVELSNSKSN